MTRTGNPKRDQLLGSADESAAALGSGIHRSFHHFRPCQQRRLDRYPADMLAHGAARAAADLAAWDRQKPYIRIESLAPVRPNGVPVSVLSIVDHNKSFLYDS